MGKYNVTMPQGVKDFMDMLRFVDDAPRYKRQVAELMKVIDDCNKSIALKGKADEIDVLYSKAKNDRDAAAKALDDGRREAAKMKVRAEQEIQKMWDALHQREDDLTGRKVKFDEYREEVGRKDILAQSMMEEAQALKKEAILMRDESARRMEAAQAVQAEYEGMRQRMKDRMAEFA